MSIEASGGKPVPGRVLARLAKQVEQAVAEADLSLPQYRMLTHLAELDCAAASALAGRLGVSRPTVTALVDGLVARGLVERRAGTHDRRRVEHLLTPAGLQALTAADEAVTARLDHLLDRIDGRGRRRAEAGVVAWGVALDRAREALLAEVAP